MALQLSACLKKAPAVVVVAAPLLMHLLAAAALAADGGGSGQQHPEVTLYAGCFRAGGCQLTPEWCPARCSFLGFYPDGAGCKVMDDGHIYSWCGPNPPATHVAPSTA